MLSGWRAGGKIYHSETRSHGGHMRKIADTIEWPRNSETTRALRQKSWTVVLRCYKCSRRFAVAKVTVDRLAFAPQVTPCMHCGAQPGGAPDLKVHHILDLREDTHRDDSVPHS